MNDFLKTLDKGHSELKISLKSVVHYEGEHLYEVRKGWKWDDVTIYV
jgi:hypothetical protein